MYSREQWYHYTCLPAGPASHRKFAISTFAVKTADRIWMSAHLSPSGLGCCCRYRYVCFIYFISLLGKFTSSYIKKVFLFKKERKENVAYGQCKFFFPVFTHFFSSSLFRLSTFLLDPRYPIFLWGKNWNRLI